MRELGFYIVAVRAFFVLLALMLAAAAIHAACHAASAVSLLPMFVATGDVIGIVLTAATAALGTATSIVAPCGAIALLQMATAPADEL